MSSYRIMKGLIGTRFSPIGMSGPLRPDVPSARRSMKATSNKRFGEALRQLMNERGLSYRGLAAATRELDGKGVTHAHINMLANGHDKPPMRAIELIAKTCRVEPTFFAEYRLAVAMRQLDPSEVGLEQALENLNASLTAQRRAAARTP
jgi:transcriptional regulator with XRE-family HTH domain